MTDSERVLLVTDIPDQARSYADALSTRGYTVELAASGKAALVSMRVHPPSCAIIDERLPDMSGWDLCRSAKAEPPLNTVPMIVLTRDSLRVPRRHRRATPARRPACGAHAGRYE